MLDVNIMLLGLRLSTFELLLMGLYLSAVYLFQISRLLLAGSPSMRLYAAIDRL